MKPMLRSVSSVIAFSALLSATAQTTPFTYQDMLMLDRIGGVAVDPTGHYAAFNVRATDMENNKGVSTFWLKDLMKPAVPEVKLGVSEGGAFDASWSQDGKQLYFLSGRGEGGTTQLWKTDVSGAKAKQVTRLPLDIAAYRITPDGKGIVVSLAIDEACKDDAITCTVTKNKARAADKSSGMVYTKLFVRHWDTWADGTRNHLYYVPMDGSTPPVALMPGFDGDVPSKPWGGAEDFFISPDSRTVYFAARFAGTTEPWSTNFDIFSVPITGGKNMNLTEANPAWDATPVVSPDGKTLAYKAMKRPGFEADRFEIQLRDAAGKVTRLGGSHHPHRDA